MEQVEEDEFSTPCTTHDIVRAINTFLFVSTQDCTRKKYLGGPLDD